MSKKNSKVCGVCDPPVYERNHYYYGKLMTVRDFCREQEYFNEKRRLLNRMVLGWGVVCGLDVRLCDHELIVQPGLALDCCGREILVCEEQKIRLKQLEKHCHGDPPTGRHRLVVCLEYDECKTERVNLPAIGCGHEEEKWEYNRVRDHFRITVKPWDRDCHRHPDTCVCPLDEVKREYHAEICRTPSVHEILCGHLKRCPECEECQCVVLATVTIQFPPPPDPYKDRPDAYPEQQQRYPEQEKRNPEREGRYHEREERPYREEDKSPDKYPYDKPKPAPPKIEVDSCTHRRFVYRNPLLYDLIDCYHGDLPHIVDFGWREIVHPHRRIDWPTFVELVKQKRIWVVFDRPMQDSTLNRHTFLVEVFITDQATGHKRMRRIPCDGIDYEERDGCHYAIFCPDPHWSDDELENPRHSELDDGIDVEIKVRGAGVVSRDGKAMDGVFNAYRLPTGNGTQGTDFCDWFHVEARRRSPGGYEGAE